MGRPSSFTQEIADEICKRMADGQTLRQVCRADDMPSRRTVYRWIEANAEFRDQYARAREDLIEHWADELLAIADDASDDYEKRERQDGTEYESIDQDHINRARLRVDTRKWLMSKLAPRKYGDKIEHTGPQGGPLQVTWLPPPAA